MSARIKKTRGPDHDADPPVELALRERYPTYRNARRREAQATRWTRAKKEALIEGDEYRLRSMSRRAPREGRTP